MSLNWEISKVKNWKQKKRSKRQRAILEALIWSTMVVGFYNITEKNYKRFYARLTAFEHLHGAFLMGKKKPYYITLEDVQNWIGLWTNAGSFNASKFEQRLVSSI